MSNALMERMLKAGSIKTAEVLSKSSYFNEKDIIQTSLPILNVAFSGELTGGMVSGLTILAGESKSYKTLLSLYCMKAYLDKYEDAIGILYDSEFGITPEYLIQQGIDPDRVVHIPVEHIEQLKFDIVKRLEEIKRGDKVFTMVDSLGLLPSKKEVDDAVDEKSVADMTRAKAIRSLFRIITPHLTTKDIPCVVINHVYKTMEMYAQNVVSGGTAVMLAANQVFIISRSQDKSSDGSLEGWNFTINIEKSRFVKEKSKLTFNVNFEKGINIYSGLLDLSLESGHVVKPKKGYYSRVNIETGEIEPDSIKEEKTNCKEFWSQILTDKKFHKFVKNKFKLTTNNFEIDEDD